MSYDIIYSISAVSTVEQMHHKISDIVWSSSMSDGAHYDYLQHGIRPLLSGTYLMKFRATGHKNVEDEILNLGAHIGQYEAKKLVSPVQLYKIDAVQSVYIKNKTDSYNISCVNTVVIKFRYTPFEPAVDYMFMFGLSHYNTGQSGTIADMQNIYYTIIRISDNYY